MLRRRNEDSTTSSVAFDIDNFEANFPDPSMLRRRNEDSSPPSVTSDLEDMNELETDGRDQPNSKHRKQRNHSSKSCWSRPVIIVLCTFAGLTLVFEARLHGAVSHLGGQTAQSQRPEQQRKEYLQKSLGETSLVDRVTGPFVSVFKKIKNENDVDQGENGEYLDYSILESLPLPVPNDTSKWHDTLGLHFVQDASKGLDENSLKKAVAKRTLWVQAMALRKEAHLPNHTLPELLALPSAGPLRAKQNGGRSPTTVILNHWKRESLELQLQALAGQTLRPEQVWVCLFNSDRVEYYRAIVDRYKAEFDNQLYMVISEFNFKYFGRFQFALQASTKYVWIIDDDILPGARFLEILNHVGGIKDLKGAFGSIGWLMPHFTEPKLELPSYRDPGLKGGLYFPDMRYRVASQALMAADLLCSQWFLETDSVRLLFREPWVTFETAEDYHLAYSMRKFADLPSYVLPMDLTDSRTWGNVDLQQTLQAVAATTTMDMVHVRMALWRRLAQRGGDYFWLRRRPRPPVIENVGRLLLVIDSPEAVAPAAEMYKRLYWIREKWEADFKKRKGLGYSSQQHSLTKDVEALFRTDFSAGSKQGKCRNSLRGDLMVALAGFEGVTCPDFIQALGCGGGGGDGGGDAQWAARACSGQYYGFFDLRLAGDYPGAHLRGRDLYALALTAAAQVARNAGVAAIIHVTSEDSAVGSAAGDGVAMASRLVVPDRAGGGRGRGGGGGGGIGGGGGGGGGVPRLALPAAQAAGPSGQWAAALAPRDFRDYTSINPSLLLLVQPSLGKEGLLNIFSQMMDCHYEGAEEVPLAVALPAAGPRGGEGEGGGGGGRGGRLGAAAAAAAAWPRGRASVRPGLRPVVTFGQMLNSWFPESEDDALIILQVGPSTSKLPQSFYTLAKFSLFIQKQEVAGDDGEQKLAGAGCIRFGTSNEDTIGYFSASFWKGLSLVCTGERNEVQHLFDPELCSGDATKVLERVFQAKRCRDADTASTS